MPLHLQAKLLRALEQKEITPVGGTEPVKIDVRFLAATNRTLADEVENGRFRKDLFYRLNVVEIHIPSLTSRRDDIPLLIRHFIDKYSREMNKPVKGVDNAAMRALMQHEWKGEIRELENVIERAIIFCDGEFISPKHLPGNIVPETNQAIRGTSLTLKDALKQYERQHILQELERNKYNREKTAEQLGISVSSLYRKMDELGIELK
jgi:transcriptional regulator with PAS, ATPase and Fis domain